MSNDKIPTQKLRLSINEDRIKDLDVSEAEVESGGPGAGHPSWLALVVGGTGPSPGRSPSPGGPSPG